MYTYEARAEFCQIFRSFWGQWSFKKNTFEIYCPLVSQALIKTQTFHTQCGLKVHEFDKYFRISCFVIREYIIKMANLRYGFS